MVSYTESTFLLRLHSKGFSKVDFMGVFKQPVFRACNPSPGVFLANSIATILSKIGAPGTISRGNSVVLIDVSSVLESPFQSLKGAR
jgi:hypothetical protein